MMDSKVFIFSSCPFSKMLLTNLIQSNNLFFHLVTVVLYWVTV